MQGDHQDWLRRAIRRAKFRTFEEEREARASGFASIAPSAVPRAASTSDTATATAAPTDDEQAESETSFASLPDDSLLVIAHRVLRSDVRAAVRLLSTSAEIRDRLDVVLEAARACKVRWLPEWTVLHRIGNDGRTLTAEGATAEDGTTLSIEDGMTRSWAAGALLPPWGVSRWSVHIECAPPV